MTCFIKSLLTIFVLSHIRTENLSGVKNNSQLPKAGTFPDLNSTLHALHLKQDCLYDF